MNKTDRKDDFMKKRWIYSGVGAVGAGALTFLLKDENRRTGLKDKAKSFTNTIRERVQNDNNSGLPVEKAGVPEADHVENTKMVDEGSQFGVQYYNKIREEDAEEIQKQDA